MSYAKGFNKGWLIADEQIKERKRYQEELAEKKRSVFSSQVLPRIVKVQSQREQIQANMEYLEQRGLDEKALSALYGDPEALKAATTLLREGDGANWSPEEANSYIRAAATDKDPETSSKDHFNSQSDLMKELLSSDPSSLDLNQSLATAYQLEAGTPRTGTIEFPTVPGQAGVDPEMTRRWELQEKVFNDRIVEAAQFRANQLNGDPDATRRQAQLLEDIEKYDSNLNSRITLRKEFATVALEAMRSADFQPEALLGLERNPLIFLLDQETGTTTNQPSEGSPVTEDTYMGQNVIDGVVYHYYALPDGTFKRVRGR